MENIPFEVFSPFSATFAEVRKVQVDFFLEHWSEIRASDAMRNVWRQIRNGRHPGFEEGPWLSLNAQFGAHGLASFSVALHCPSSGVQSTHWGVGRCRIARDLVAVAQCTHTCNGDASM